MAYEIVDARFVEDNLGTLPILDVRPTFMYEESRIPGAVSVSLMDAKEADGETSRIFTDRVAAKNFKTNDRFIVYCFNGELAREACDYLQMNGYDGILCYEGSWVDWISDPSRPIEA